MTSKAEKLMHKATERLSELPNEPKTPHEEVMFVVESTNEIVSKILEILEKHVEKEPNYEWDKN